jgi:DNA-directed RNA polymerase specialized sigma24 family protein
LETRPDLLREIHRHLGRSLENFAGRGSLTTRLYRVADNVATGHVIRQSRIRNRLVRIENIEALPGGEPHARINWVPILVLFL